MVQLMYAVRDPRRKSQIREGLSEATASPAPKGKIESHISE